MHKIFISLITIFILSGCTTTYSPTPKGYKGPLAQIHDTSIRADSNKAYFFEIKKIDGREIETSSRSTQKRNHGRGFSMTTVTESREVPAKKSLLSLQAKTHFSAPILAMMGDTYLVKGDVSVDLKSGENYFIKGTLSKEYSAIWVENNTGTIISNVIKKGLKPTKLSITKAPIDSTLVYFFTSPVFMINKGIHLTANEVKYSYLEPKKFMKIALPKGRVKIHLKHSDLFTFNSDHILDVSGKEMYVELKPTITSNEMTVSQEVPKQYLEIQSKY